MPPRYYFRNHDLTHLPYLDGNTLVRFALVSVMVAHSLPPVMLHVGSLWGMDEDSGFGGFDALAGSRIREGVADGTDLGLSSPRPPIRSGKGIKP